MVYYLLSAIAVAVSAVAAGLLLYMCLARRGAYSAGSLRKPGRAVAFSALFITVTVSVAGIICVTESSRQPYPERGVRKAEAVFSDYSESDGVLFFVRSGREEERYILTDYRASVASPARLIALAAQGEVFDIRYIPLYDDEWKGQYVLVEIVSRDGTVFLSSSASAAVRARAASPMLISLTAILVLWAALGTVLLIALAFGEKLPGAFGRAARRLCALAESGYDEDERVENITEGFEI